MSAEWRKDGHRLVLRGCPLGHPELEIVCPGDDERYCRNSDDPADRCVLKEELEQAGLEAIRVPYGIEVTELGDLAWRPAAFEEDGLEIRLSSGEGTGS
jgi:hypothetical protein